MKDFMFDIQSEDTIIGYNQEGEEKVLFKLAEFDLTETGKHYLIYTDNERNEEWALNVFASTVREEGRLIYFDRIETDKEWEVINSVIIMLQENI